MPVVAMVGAQWGDEGKGKIADVLAAQADVMARFNGGNNAGHTVVVAGAKMVLRLVPVGVLHPGVSCYIGRGCVVNPTYLLEELEGLRAAGVDTSRVMVDWHCHVILPYHIALDLVGDERLGAWRIGTTGRGIGPCYADRASRLGLRLADLYDADRLRERLRAVASRYTGILGDAVPEGGERKVEEDLRAAASALMPYVGDTSSALRHHLARGDRVFLEGAHGFLLDLDFGSFPFVTSSNVHPAAAATSLGFPAAAIGNVLGVVKAYQTRVGEGPMPTELADDVGRRLQTKGNEYGATTGRPRRCGWLDLVLLKYAVEAMGVTSVALNKIDVLDDLETVAVCVAYEEGGERKATPPVPFDRLARVRPVYEELHGWTGAAGAASWEDLPAAARAYVAYIERYVGAPVIFISTGAAREEGFFRRSLW